MRCDECKVEPLTPGHFCECCGRKLSLQERKALDEKEAPQQACATSWGEPAPVLAKPRKGDQFAGVHAPELYVDAGSEAPAPYADLVPEAETAPPPLDPVLEAHFAAHFGDAPAPAVPPAAAAAIDPILEGHFAGHAPVGAGRAVPVGASGPVPAAQETHSVAAVSVDAVHAMAPYADAMHAGATAAHHAIDATPARCESCGGPAEDGDLCTVCQQAFHALLDNTNPSLPAHVVADAAAPAREAAVAPELPPAVSAAPAAIAVAPSANVVAVAAPAPSPVAAAGATPAPVKSVIRLKAPPPPPDVVPVAPVDPVPPAKVPKPVAPVAAAAVPRAQRTSPVRTIAGAAAVIVVIAAIGFPMSKLWLGGQESSLIIREAPPAVKSPEGPARTATPPGIPAPAATTARAESVVQAPAVPPAPPKPLRVAAAPSKAGAAVSNTQRSAAARVPPRTGRQPVAPVRQAAVAVPSPVAPTPAPEVAAPAPVAAAPASAPEPPPVPVGPFFELRDVNETPRVATRVEPQVPDDLRDRPLNEVVIVRVLVTQAGHPLMINLLRKSKAGPSLDSAIVAAVKQWTFVPARKRGEAVSCWFHVGVPVSGAN